MATATLTAIQNKVRRLTRSPSTNQLADTTLNEYINTFILYDMPQELRLFSLHKVYKFVLTPFQDTYNLNTLTTDSGETLSNVLLDINPPFYVDGYKTYYAQSREAFYNVYPFNIQTVQIATGDGTQGPFTGSITNVGINSNGSPPNTGPYILPNSVMISCLTTSNGKLAVSDNGSGTLSGNGSGTINYYTGAYSVTFDDNTLSGQPINVHMNLYTANRPSAVLYYDNTFVFRPVPDQPYTINFEYYALPTELSTSSDVPNLKEWWQYIAYGAAIKVLQDRMDMETVASIMPEFKKQERLVLRRTLVQNSTQRTATIYSEQAGLYGAFDFYYNRF